MRSALLAIAIAGICLEVTAQNTRTTALRRRRGPEAMQPAAAKNPKTTAVSGQGDTGPFNIKFAELSEENKTQLTNAPGQFFRERLLAEAEKRHVDKDVKGFLEISIEDWVRAVREDAHTSGVIIDAAKKGELDPILAAAALKDRRNLLEDRYFALATSKGVPYGEFNVQGKVSQVLDKKNLIARIHAIGSDDPSTFWIEGVDTDGLFDDAELSIAFFATRLWSINGTRSYTTTVGAKKTVPLLKLAPLEKSKITEQKDLFEFGRHWKSFELLCNESNKASKAVALEKERAAKTRNWTDSSGKFSVEAEYHGLAGGNVVLKKTNGGTTKVPLGHLSKEDQEWIKLWQQRRKK